jgi:hypothetical protein
MLEVIPEKSFLELHPEKGKALFCLQNSLSKRIYLNGLFQYSRQPENGSNLFGNNGRKYFCSIIERKPEFVGIGYHIAAFTIQIINLKFYNYPVSCSNL